MAFQDPCSQIWGARSQICFVASLDQLPQELGLAVLTLNHATIEAASRNCVFPICSFPLLPDLLSRRLQLPESLRSLKFLFPKTRTIIDKTLNQTAYIS